LFSGSITVSKSDIYPVVSFDRHLVTADPIQHANANDLGLVEPRVAPVATPHQALGHPTSENLWRPARGLYTGEASGPV